MRPIMMHLMASSYLTPPAGPGITLVGTVTALAVNVTTFEVSIASLNIQPGDVLVIAADNGNLTTAQTFTATGNASGAATGIATLYANGTDDTSLFAAYLKVGATPDVSVTVTLSTQNRYAIAIRAYRGVHATTQLDVAATTVTGTGSSLANPPAITPVTAGAKIVAVYGAATAAATYADWVAPANMSNFTQYNDATNAPKVALADNDWTSGSFDPAAVTGGTTNAADSFAGITIALRPAATGAPAAVYGPELVSNGTFSTTSTTGWAVSNCTVAAASGTLTVTSTSSGTNGVTSQSFTTVVGQVYKVFYTGANGTGTAYVQAANAATTAQGSGIAHALAATNGSFTFTATATTTFIQLWVSKSTGNTATYDYVSVRHVL